MADAVEFGPYSTVAKWRGNAPSWVPPAHQDRVQAYQTYIEMYWSHISTTYKVMNRGLDSNDEPVYVPSSRILVNTVNRYVGNDLTFQVDPLTGSPASRALAELTFKNLFQRERFASKYNANKRSGLTKGDWLWHIVADESKEPGKRIAILPVDPGSYFPVYHDELEPGGDPEKVLQVKLVERVVVDETAMVRVQLYDTWETNGKVLSSLTLWKEDEWFNPEKSAKQVLIPPTPLPDAVTTIPVYHLPNSADGAPFGSSEVRGLETIAAALNQGVTDEDLALAMMGLGVYATEQTGSPINPLTGEATSWFIYPGAVVENAKGLHRVEGITTTAPYDSHLDRLSAYIGDATGATAAARGQLQVQEAESGIALLMRLGPTLSMAAEKDRVILDVHAQMFYDLVQMWLPTFEGVNVTDCTVLPVLGDKLPVNRVAEANLAASLVLAEILSAQSAREYLARKGFKEMFSEDEGARVLAEKKASAAAALGTEPGADREAAEVDSGAVEGTGGPVA